MCFSATASFTVGAALIPAGMFCVQQAIVKKPSYLGLAVVPLLFGVQQIAEGFVWRGIEQQDPALVQNASLVFLLFALAVWPFWMPVQAAMMETQSVRRRILIGMCVVGAVWFWILFVPLWRDADGLLTTRVERHSIQYFYPRLPIYNFIRPTLLRVLYFANVALPLAISSERWGVLPGIALGLSVLVAALVFEYAFVSVWCFFAAVLAGFCCVMFHRLPRLNRDGAFVATLPPADSSI